MVHSDVLYHTMNDDVAGIGDLDDFGSLSSVPATVKVSSTKKVTTDKPRITVM